MFNKNKLIVVSQLISLFFILFLLPHLSLCATYPLVSLSFVSIFPFMLWLCTICYRPIYWAMSTAILPVFPLHSWLCYHALLCYCILLYPISFVHFCQTMKLFTDEVTNSFSCLLTKLQVTKLLIDAVTRIVNEVTY